MSQPFRLANGGSIDRSRPLVFTFDGLDYQGYAGDTLASALIANGVHLVGRSFKYHRPRGILSAGAEEPNALVTVTARPRPSDPEPARDPDRALRRTRRFEPESLAVAHVRRRRRQRPLLASVRRGLLLQDLHGPELLGKNWAWARVYEPMIRRAAGLGAPPREPDPDRYTRTFDHCDVLIVGAGPAGLAAALAASQSGARVVLCDENPALGGSLLAEG